MNPPINSNRDMLGRSDTVSLKHALDLLQQHLPPCTARKITVSPDEALGRICAENVLSPENLPPYPRSTMDGYAVRAKDTFGAIDMQILATNVDTDVEKRDNHLKSPDFFDAKKFPLISFKGTSFKKIAENTYEIIGDITLLGKTRPVSLKAIQTGAAKDPWGKYRRAFEAEFTIKRSDFGMDFLMNVAADEVELTVSVEGIRQ